MYKIEIYENSQLNKVLYAFNWNATKSLPLWGPYINQITCTRE